MSMAAASYKITVRDTREEKLNNATFSEKDVRCLVESLHRVLKISDDAANGLCKVLKNYLAKRCYDCKK